MTFLSTTAGKNPLEENGLAFIVNKRVWNVVLWCSLKNDRIDLSSFPRQIIQHTVIQVYAPTTNAKEVEVEQFYEDLQDLLELTQK